MLTLERSYGSFDDSLTSGGLLAALEGLYTSLRKIVGRALLLFLAATLGVPFSFLLVLLLKRQRRRFVLAMRNDDVNLHTVEDYVTFRSNLDKLLELKSSLQKVNCYNLKNAPIGVRFLLNQMQKTSTTILTFLSWNEQKLSEFNMPRNTSSSSFTFVSENELWENRNPAYSYWM